MASGHETEGKCTRHRGQPIPSDTVNHATGKPDSCAVVNVCKSATCMALNCAVLMAASRPVWLVQLAARRRRTQQRLAHMAAA